jgi:hypothetical protein
MLTLKVKVTPKKPTLQGFTDQARDIKEANKLLRKQVKDCKEEMSTYRKSVRTEYERMSLNDSLFISSLKSHFLSEIGKEKTKELFVMIGDRVRLQLNG